MGRQLRSYFHALETWTHFYVYSNSQWSMCRVRLPVTGRLRNFCEYLKNYRNFPNQTPSHIDHIHPSILHCTGIGRMSENKYIDKQSHQSNLPITGCLCQISDTTMPVTGHPIKKTYTSIFQTYFNTVNLLIFFLKNIYDLGCIRCW